MARVITPKGQAVKKLVIVAALTVAAGSAAAQWKYSAKRDPMTDAVTKGAVLKSVTTANFSFPYAGGTHEWLGLREPDDGDTGTVVMLSIDRGQIIARQGVSIRFDDGEAVVFAEPSEPADGSTQAVFLQFPGVINGCTPPPPGNYAADCQVDVDEFLRRLAVAKRVRAQATYHEEGRHVFEFRPVGLKWAIPPASVAPKAD